MRYALPNPPDAVEPVNSFNSLTGRQLFQALIEKWWLILLLAAGAGAGGYVYAHRMPTNYLAKVVLQVDQEEQKLMSIEEVTRQDLRASEVVNTIIQSVKNSSVLERVVKSNHLAAEPLFLPNTFTNLSEAKLAGVLSGMITAKLRPETRLIDLTVVHPNPAMAQKLANSVAEEFIRQNLDQRFNATRAANELLYEEAGKLKSKLEGSEKKLQAYKELNQTVSLEDRQNIIVEKLKGLNVKYTAAKADCLQLEADLKQMQNLTNQPEAMLTLSSVLQDPATSEIRRKVVEQEAQVATLSLRYKPQYPKMVHAQQQLDDLKAALKHLAMTAPRQLLSAYEIALARENSFAKALKEVQLESLELDKKGIQFNVLMRDVLSDRALYESVLKRLKETDVSKGLEKTSIAVVEPAGRPSKSVKPSTAVITALAMVAGLLLGVGLVYLMKMFDNSIRTVDQAEAILGLPVLAAIPVTKRLKNGNGLHVVAEQPGSICSEAFRTLRTTTGLLGRDGEKRILVFTSADPDEGKTFFSLNHAICKAQEGKRTLLIDLDLRRPSIGECFSCPPETPGVTSYLLGQDSLANLVQTTPYPNLHVLVAGPKISNPAEELGGDNMRRLLEEASAAYDHIVIDTPPINAVSDTFLILPLAQIICLVVRAGKTPQRAIIRAVELMSRANFSPAGIVLNFLPTRSGLEYYYHYSPRNGYKSDGVYGVNYPSQITLDS